MAQGTFPIVGARQELGFTPTTAVRANIDVTTGEGAVGAAIGQGAIQVTQNVIAIRREQERMRDTRAQIDANALVTEAVNENKAFRNTNADTTTWGLDLDERLTGVESRIGALDLSDDARALVNTRFAAQSKTARSLSLIAETDRDKEDTRAAIINDVIEAYSSGTEQTQKDSAIRFLQVSPALWDSNEARATLKTAVRAGRKVNVDNLVNTVHAAIELGSKTGDFTVAIELAKNPAIPETKQTSLRTAIKTAESAKIAELKNQETALINTATSTAIRDYYKGDQTVANLNKKHEAGLIKDSDFKFMMEGLQNPAPDQSNVFSRNLVGRAITNFQSGGSTRQDVERIMLKEFPRLSISDRNKFMDKLETEVVAGRENSIREAKSRGSALISKRFGGAKTIEEMLSVFASATKEDKRIFEVEWRNRNLYEDAIDDWVAGKTKEGKELTPRDIRIISNDFLVDYRKTKELDIDLAEAEVTRREQLARPLPPAPLAEAKTLEELSQERTIKPVSEMTRAEKQAELKRIRELK